MVGLSISLEYFYQTIFIVMVIFVSVVCTLGQKHPEDINFATKITTLSYTYWNQTT